MTCLPLLCYIFNDTWIARTFVFPFHFRHPYPIVSISCCLCHAIPSWLSLTVVITNTCQSELLSLYSVALQIHSLNSIHLAWHMSLILALHAPVPMTLLVLSIIAVYCFCLLPYMLLLETSKSNWLLKCYWTQF